MSFITCNSCQLVRINGVVCHETGCPESWRNPVTGRGYPVPCWQCGYDFEPEDKANRHSRCPDCQECEDEERYQAAMALGAPNGEEEEGDAEEDSE